MKKFLFFFLLSLPAYSQSFQVSVGSNLTSYLFVNSASTNPANMRPASGMHLSITVNSKTERLGVELYIDDAESKIHFAALLAQRKSIESKLGFELDWQELPDAHACRIAHWCPESPIEDESRWAEYQDWVAEHLLKMDEVLRPIVKSLP